MGLGQSMRQQGFRNSAGRASRSNTPQATISQMQMDQSAIAQQGNPYQTQSMSPAQAYQAGAGQQTGAAQLSTMGQQAQAGAAQMQHTNANSQGASWGYNGAFGQGGHAADPRAGKAGSTTSPGPGAGAWRGHDAGNAARVGGGLYMPGQGRQGARQAGQNPGGGGGAGGGGGGGGDGGGAAGSSAPTADLLEDFIRQQILNAMQGPDAAGIEKRYRDQMSQGIVDNRARFGAMGMGGSGAVASMEAGIANQARNAADEEVRREQQRMWGNALGSMGAYMGLEDVAMRRALLEAMAGQGDANKEPGGRPPSWASHNDWWRDPVGSAMDYAEWATGGLVDGQGAADAQKEAHAGTSNTAGGWLGNLLSGGQGNDSSFITSPDQIPSDQTIVDQAKQGPLTIIKTQGPDGKVSMFILI